MVTCSKLHVNCFHCQHVGKAVSILKVVTVGGIPVIPESFRLWVIGLYHLPIHKSKGTWVIYVLINCHVFSKLW